MTITPPALNWQSQHLYNCLELMYSRRFNIWYKVYESQHGLILQELPNGSDTIDPQLRLKAILYQFSTEHLHDISLPYSIRRPEEVVL